MGLNTNERVNNKNAIYSRRKDQNITSLLQYMASFSKQGRVPLYLDRFSPVIAVHAISRDLSVLPQSCSICSSPLFVSCSQSLMFRFFKQARVIFYSVIFVFDISRDLSVLPQS